MTKARVERVIEGHDLTVRVDNGVTGRELAMRLTGLAHDLLAELAAADAPALDPAPENGARAERRTRVCPVCDAAGDDPCRDTRRGHRRRAMKKNHPDRQ